MSIARHQESTVTKALDARGVVASAEAVSQLQKREELAPAVELLGIARGDLLEYRADLVDTKAIDRAILPTELEVLQYFVSGDIFRLEKNLLQHGDLFWGVLEKTLLSLYYWLLSHRQGLTDEQKVEHFRPAAARIWIHASQKFGPDFVGDLIQRIIRDEAKPRDYRLASLRFHLRKTF